MTWPRVSAARAEFHDLAALGRGYHPRRFTRDHGLKAEGGQEIGLHDLAFDDRRGEAQEGLARECEGAFGHGPHVSGKAEILEVIEKVVANISESGVTPEITNLVGSEADFFQELERGFQPRGDQIIAVGRKMSNEELESGARVEASLQVACSHGQFVQIGE